MENISTFLPYLNFAGWVVAGGFALYGVFNKKQRERRVDDDQTASNLINNLKITVDLQEKSIEKMQRDMEQHSKERDIEIKDLRDKVQHLTGRNSVLEDLFRGRDPAMQNFLKDAPNLMEIARENNGLAKETTKALVSLTISIQHLIERLPIKEATQ